MRSVLRSTVLNPYKSRRPVGFYGILGHRGIDLRYNNEELPSPVTGKVVLTTHQKEMGQCLYLMDAMGSIHIFGHLNKFVKQLGDNVKRNEVLAITGNTGSKTTAPHLHWEIITSRPYRPIVDRFMKRTLSGFSGFNTEPFTYLKNLYFKYHVDLDGNQITNI